MGAWLYPRLPAGQLVVDGKTIRGARAGDGRAVHVLAAMLAGSRTVIAQREIAAKTNEITTFAPLLAEQDLSGVLVSADALHTQRAHARFLVEDKNADYLLVVKDNQPGLFAQLNALPWPKYRSPTSSTTAVTAASSGAPSRYCRPPTRSSSRTPRRPSWPSATSLTCTATPSPRSPCSA